MNYLWGGMLIVGIIYGALTGNLNEVANGAINASKEAVSLAIALLGVTAMWSGLMEIASGAGIIDWLTRKIRPILRFLFPRIPDGHPALEAISVNMSENFFGLGQPQPQPYCGRWRNWKDWRNNAERKAMARPGERRIVRCVRF